jgi:hypothetical protein
MLTQGLDKAAQAWEEAQVEKLVSKLGTGDAAVGWGNLLAAMSTDGKINERGEDWLDDWSDKLEDPSKDNEWADMKDQEKLDELIAMASASGGDIFKKTHNPKEYWEQNKPKTAQDFKDIAQAQAEGKLKTKENPSGFTRDNTAAIEEGRRLLEGDRKGGQERHPGTGIPVEKITEEVAEETVATDPRAGAFNVGGTMPYTHDVATAGAEMNVPLGRRFNIDKAGKFRGTTPKDLNEAMQYATLGGYSQLEPFQEYLTRRREYLDEDEPQYFDEEGNVIYSTVT